MLPLWLQPFLTAGLTLVPSACSLADGRTASHHSAPTGKDPWIRPAGRFTVLLFQLALFFSLLPSDHVGLASLELSVLNSIKV